MVTVKLVKSKVYFSKCSSLVTCAITATAWLRVMVSVNSLTFLCKISTLCADRNNGELWLLQWSLPSTRPGVSPVSRAPPATQNSLSSKWHCSLIQRLTSCLSNHGGPFLKTGEGVFVHFTHLPHSSSLPFPWFLLSCCSWCVHGDLEISLWKSTWGPCANTVMSVCQRSWNAGWHDASATPMTARKNPQSVCRALTFTAAPLWVH